MSIKAMTWAFGLPLEPRAKIALLAIADNARDDGVAWPSRDTIAEKSSQSRATINRKLKFLTELDVLTLAERFREDGSQTTDEIRLNLALTGDELMQKMQGLSASERGDDGEEERVVDEAAPRAGHEPDDADASQGGYQADTPPVHSGHPGGAVVTPRGLHSCNPLDEPSLEPRIPPNPPLGGVRGEDGPLKKPDKAAGESRDRLWQRMLGVYPGIADMDQQAGREAFDKLPIEECEWAVSVVQHYKTGCEKLRKPPKGVHLWLRKSMFKNYPRGGPPPPRPDSFAADSPEGRALIALHQVARKTPATINGRISYRGEITPQLLTFAQAGDRSSWPWVEAGEATREQIGAWNGFVDAHVPGPRGPMLDHKGLGEAKRFGIHVPWPWPPKADGTPYAWPEQATDQPTSPEETDHG